MTADSGWVSYGPGDNSHLPADVRREVGARIAQRDAARGALQAVVSVRVFEHDEEPQVSFPPGALLGVETEPVVVAKVVARAREQLAHWR
jgi:hypothetical protein